MKNWYKKAAEEALTNVDETSESMTSLQRGADEAQAQQTTEQATEQTPQQLTQQQVLALVNKLDSKFPGIAQIWKNPGTGRQGILQVLSLFANGIDAQSAQFLRMRLQQLGNNIDSVQ